MQQIRLLDVTLNTIASALHLSFDDKVAHADKLAVGIDILDVGGVLALPDKLDLVQAIAKGVQNVAVAARAQGNMQDIQIAWNAIRRAEQPILRICIKISDWYRAEILRVSEQALLQRGADMLTYGRQLCPLVEFVAEDALRCTDALLDRFIDMAIAAGTTTMTLADTVGYASSLEYGALFRRAMKQVGNRPLVLGVAAHNRGGQALSATLAALAAGARQVTVDESHHGHLKRAVLEAALGRQRASHKDEDQEKWPSASSC